MLITENMIAAAKKVLRESGLLYAESIADDLVVRDMLRAALTHQSVNQMMQAQCVNPYFIMANDQLGKSQ